MRVIWHHLFMKWEQKDKRSPIWGQELRHHVYVSSLEKGDTRILAATAAMILISKFAASNVFSCKSDQSCTTFAQSFLQAVEGAPLLLMPTAISRLSGMIGEPGTTASCVVSYRQKKVQTYFPLLCDKKKPEAMRISS